MSILSKKFFHDEAAAFDYLEGLIWAGNVTCPHCGNAEADGKKVYALVGVRSKPSKKNPEGVERHGLKKCGACRKQFTVRVGTVFESSHVPLHKWLQAAYLMMSSKKGISSKQLERTLEVTYKTAWFMSHRLREAMASSSLPPMGGEGAIVEADETYFGNRISLKKKKAAQRRGVKGLGGGPGNKFPIVSLVERGGSIRSFNVDRANKHTVTEIVRKNVDRKSRLMTDESRLYTVVGQEYAGHDAVNHSRGEYVRGDAYTNTLEGYYSIFKRGMKGVYQHCNEKHLHRYLAEFDFRYNNRVKLGVNDIERTEAALSGIVGKRLLYRDSSTA